MILVKSNPELSILIWLRNTLKYGQSIDPTASGFMKIEDLPSVSFSAWKTIRMG